VSSREERKLKVIVKTSLALLAGVAVSVVASEARPASACDTDGIAAAASAQARQSFSVGGTGSGGMSASVVTGLTTTPLSNGNPVIQNDYGRPAGVEARTVGSPAGVTAGDSRMSIAMGAWSLQSGYMSLIDTMSSSTWSLQSSYMPLINTMGGSTWSLRSGYVPPIHTMSSGTRSLQSGYSPLIDTMSSSEVLLQPASFTPKPD
jgi:hypothetical protein